MFNSGGNAHETDLPFSRQPAATQANNPFYDKMPFASSLEEAESGRPETPGPSTSSQEANLSDGPADPSTFSASAAVVIETELESREYPLDIRCSKA